MTTAHAAPGAPAGSAGAGEAPLVDRKLVAAWFALSRVLTSDFRAQVAQGQETLAELAGTPPRWFRAVVGMANPFVSAPLREMSMCLSHSSSLRPG